MMQGDGDDRKLAWIDVVRGGCCHCSQGSWSEEIMEEGEGMMEGILWAKMMEVK